MGSDGFYLWRLPMITTRSTSSSSSTTTTTTTEITRNCCGASSYAKKQTNGIDSPTQRARALFGDTGNACSPGGRNQALASREVSLAVDSINPMQSLATVTDVCLRNCPKVRSLRAPKNKAKTPRGLHTFNAHGRCSGLRTIGGSKNDTNTSRMLRMSTHSGATYSASARVYRGNRTCMSVCMNSPSSHIHVNERWSGPLLEGRINASPRLSLV